MNKKSKYILFAIFLLASANAAAQKAERSYVPGDCTKWKGHLCTG
jgi:hypothetical protein